MDILITDDIRNHWIFKDDRKFKWWVELNLMADENGEVHRFVYTSEIAESIA